ncbi:MAG: hypothetical protein AAGA60_22910 [Cyanobacteria bacterium P01_E01_bin.42]
MAGAFPQQQIYEREPFKAAENLEPYRFVDPSTGRYLDAYAPGVRLGVCQRRCAAGEMSGAATRGKIPVESAAINGLNVTDNGASANPRYTRNPAGTDKYLKIVADGKVDLAGSGETAIAILDPLSDWAAPAAADKQLVTIALLPEPYTLP